MADSFIDDLIRTFNCGIGMVLVVDAQNASEVQASLKAQGESVYEIGRLDTFQGSLVKFV